MYSREALIDIHERAHRSFHKLLSHCAKFGAEEINRELPGFGYPTIRLQLHHVAGAEKYWIKVLHGKVDDEDNDATFRTIESLENYRAGVAAFTADYLRNATSEELNTARKILTWGPTGNVERLLIPAHVLLRTQTHIYQHQGQMAAMCRLLGSPVNGLDFPLM